MILLESSNIDKKIVILFTAKKLFMIKIKLLYFLFHHLLYVQNVAFTRFKFYLLQYQHFILLNENWLNCSHKYFFSIN